MEEAPVENLIMYMLEVDATLGGAPMLNHPHQASQNPLGKFPDLFLEHQNLSNLTNSQSYRSFTSRPSIADLPIYPVRGNHEGYWTDEDI